MISIKVNLDNKGADETIEFEEDQPELGRVYGKAIFRDESGKVLEEKFSMLISDQRSDADFMTKWHLRNVKRFGDSISFFGESETGQKIIKTMGVEELRDKYIVGADPLFQSADEMAAIMRKIEHTDLNLLKGASLISDSNTTKIFELGSRPTIPNTGMEPEGIGGLESNNISSTSTYSIGGGNFGIKNEGKIGTVGTNTNGYWNDLFSEQDLSVKPSGNELGGIHPSLVADVINRHGNSIRYTYQKELVKNPKLKGQVFVKFVIASDGTVSDVNVEDRTLGEAKVCAELQSVFSRMKFVEPKGGGSVEVTLPINFFTKEETS